MKKIMKKLDELAKSKHAPSNKLITLVKSIFESMDIEIKNRPSVDIDSGGIDICIGNESFFFSKNCKEVHVECDDEVGCIGTVFFITEEKEIDKLKEFLTDSLTGKD
jgi:hypothetical protein